MSTFVPRLAELRGPEVARRLTAKSIIVQPLGAIEQHGPHLPLNTDEVIAHAVAEEAVGRAHAEGLDVWLLPTMAYTKSNEHAWSAGTIWISATTMLAVLDDVGRCVATTPAKRLVFFNGHGGNTALVNVANREIRLAHELMTFLAHPTVPPDAGGVSPPSEHGMGVHGGTDETSIMLFLRADLVDMTKAVRNIPEPLAKNKQVKFGGRVSFGWLSNDFGDDGHIGDPTVATRALGAKLFEAAVVSFVEALHEIATFNFGQGGPGGLGDLARSAPSTSGLPPVPSKKSGLPPVPSKSGLPPVPRLQ